MKILLVEDEEMLNGITAKYLRAENMTVDTCFNGQQAIDYVNTSSYDVIVMDIMMPILDGISALAQMRNDGNTTPVLLLTAKDSLQDKVTGLNTGADDYLVKPFDLEELTARIYALARRNARHAQNDIHVGPLTINVPQRTVKRDGETITLTAKEFDLLFYLASNENIVLSRQQILPQSLPVYFCRNMIMKATLILSMYTLKIYVKRSILMRTLNSFKRFVE